MHYLGGKFRIAKNIGSVINNIPDIDGIWEPFCGACWITQQLNHDIIYASDINNYLIEMYKALQRGWTPPNIVTEDQYNKVKENPEKYMECYVAFVGFGCSWSGKWFGGYARDGTGRNYALNAKNSLLKMLPKIQRVNFQVVDYNQDYHSGMNNYIIYCDPPYAGTTQYDFARNFDHEKFWNMNRAYSVNNIVIVSEYTAPEDFVEIASFATRTDIRNANKDRIERLFVHQTRQKFI